MRDLAEKWSPAPDWRTATITAPGLAIRSLAGFSQYLISGNLGAWYEQAGLDGAAAGALTIVQGDPYALRVARDRILVVSTSVLAIEPGWHEQGFAVTAFDAGLHMFDIEGPATPSLFARATTLDPEGATASAGLLFAGTAVLCCRHGHGDRLRLHIDRALAPYLWRWLERTVLL
ncbi:hypothetical protein G5V57_32655 [Nordella sp. HKS 07]|uniref:hypothetical protein n=1 Tax=Nordella sp. HKS 07 TaxID=2712222 RepID=UPI0013E19A97|nr:hypothetical protein [Nordella sp. HKS 07]QIG52039.1 hypothetical protein G5V57_32655 [Nordella sp. HKS 07]